MKKLDRLIAAEDLMTNGVSGQVPKIIKAFVILCFLPFMYIGMALIVGVAFLTVVSFTVELFKPGHGDFFFNEWRGTARGIILGTLLCYYITLIYNYFKVGKHD